MDTVNIGMIGLGEWPRTAYLPNLAKIEAANVVAVSARSEETRTFASEHFGGSLKTCADYEDILSDPNIDAVMVAVPNHLHARIIQAAAASGKHVFFEPPMGLNEDEIMDTIAAVEDAQGIIQIDHELRYTPVMGKAKSLMAEGVIGDILMAKVRLWADWSYAGNGLGEATESQNYFLWLGLWYLDILDAIFEKTPKAAAVAGGRAKCGAMTDHGWAALDYGDGHSGAWEFSMISPFGQDTSVHILGTRGEMSVDLWEGQLQYRIADGVWKVEDVPCEEPHGFSGMYESINGFVKAISEGEPVAANIDVIRRVHAAALMCARADKDAHRLP